MKKIYKIILIFIFTVSLIYYGLLVILKSWKYSSFYEPDVNLLENSNSKRIQLALDFFSTNKNTINKYRMRKENNVTHHRPQLCIGVLTAIYEVFIKAGVIYYNRCILFYPDSKAKKIELA